VPYRSSAVRPEIRNVKPFCYYKSIYYVHLKDPPATGERIEGDVAIGLILPDFSAPSSQPGFMRPPAESLMKVHVTQGFLATRSHAAKSCLSILEPAGPRSASPHACLEGLADEILAKNVFRFTDFHGHQAARPRGWPLRMTSGKVRKDQANRDHGRLGSPMLIVVMTTPAPPTGVLWPSKLRAAALTASTISSLCLFYQGDGYQ
jgi:hypothetical protein